MKKEHINKRKQEEIEKRLNCRFCDDGDFAEMSIDLGDYHEKTAPIEGVSYGFFKGNLNEIHEIVAKVLKDWVSYFNEGDLIFCGFVNDKPVSFCTVECNCDCLISSPGINVGEIGCVGTLPEYRCRGIGLRMVDLATMYLKDQGCDKAYLHYTARDKWYGKLGYEVFARFSFMDKSSMEIDVNGIKLFYEVKGDGEPLLLLHGNGEDHSIFDEAVEALKDSFTCYAIDSRGHGQSSPADYLDYDLMAEDIVQFIEKLDLNNVSLYGFSDGGIIGLIAAQHTDRLKNLIVSGANTNPKGMKSWLTVVFKVIYFCKRDPKIKMMLEEPHISDDDLHKINVRTLVLAGDKDLIKEGHTKHLAENIKNSTLKILPGEEHGSYIIHSEKIAGLIKEFICG